MFHVGGHDAVVEEPCGKRDGPALGIRSVLIGDSAFTYQNRSAAPVVSAPMMRTGAFLEKARAAPMMPPHPDIDAAREHRLQRLGAALGVEQLQRQAMLLEDACALAELGYRGIPIAALANRELQHILRAAIELADASAGNERKRKADRLILSRMTCLRWGLRRARALATLAPDGPNVFSRERQGSGWRHRAAFEAIAPRRRNRYDRSIKEIP